MFKKILLTLAVLVSLGCLEARALGNLSSDILVTLREGERTVNTGSVELCRTGDLTEDGFLLNQELGGGLVNFQDASSADLALFLSRKAQIGLVETVDSHGLARFSGMEPGLYLVRQKKASEGYYSFRPYFVTVTGEMTLVDTYPVMEPLEGTPRTAESPRPYLAALAGAITFAGAIFWDQARRQEEKQQIS